MFFLGIDNDDDDNDDDEDNYYDITFQGVLPVIHTMSGLFVMFLCFEASH